MAERRAVWLYGDGPLAPGTPVLFFEEAGVVCDFSECGTYIASKFMAHGDELPTLAILRDVVRQLEKLYRAEEVEVRAYNNGIAVRLASLGVKTLADLIKAIA